MNRKHRYEPLVSEHGDSIRIHGYSSIMGYLVPIDDSIFMIVEIVGMWNGGIIDCRVM